MPVHITVAHPRNVECFHGQVDAWAYADDCLDDFAALSLKLGKERMLISPVELQVEARRQLETFIPWADAQIPLENVHEWILTPCHRNPFASNLFLHVVWLQVLARQRGRGTIALFTKEAGLAKAVHSLCRDRGWQYSLHGRLAFWRSRSFKSLRTSAVFVHDVLRAVVGQLSARCFLGKAQLDALREVELLIDTYLYRESLGPKGEFSDRHFPGLLEWCLKRGIPAAVYPFPYVPIWYLPKLYRRMRTSTVPIFSFDLLTRPADIIVAALACVRHAFRRVECSRYGEIDVSELVRYEKFKSAMTGVLPMLLLAAPRRLAASGIRPRWLYDWYENQPIDRANTIGFDAIGCKTVALRLYGMPSMFANMYTSERQAEARACPQEAWVSGAAMERMLSKYDLRTRYRRVPALRYGQLYKPALRQTEGSGLLLLLTHSREESLAILGSVLPTLTVAPLVFQKIVIKPHIDYCGRKLHAEVMERWPWLRGVSWLEWESRPVADLLPEARIVVSAGSSAALEAVCCGIPVILIGRSAGLDMNPLAEVDSRLWTVAYDPDSFARALKEWSPAHPIDFKDRIAIGESIRADYFEPVSEDGLAVFDPREQANQHCRQAWS